MFVYLLHQIWKNGLKTKFDDLSVKVSPDSYSHLRLTRWISARRGHGTNKVWKYAQNFVINIYIFSSKYTFIFYSTSLYYLLHIIQFHFSNPTPYKDPILQDIKWPLVNSSPGNLLYLNIDSNLTIQRNPFNEAMLFWDRIYKTFGDPPYNTYWW